ncbi:MAG: response regulator [Microscillaceae bacterium]|jgi:DNA-binding LytR/AlgR family response regulator|nr:response regulator [Microscillaceae bacterium]
MIRILAAEDDAIFANSLEMFIDRLDYELIKITDNSEELLRLAAATKPDIILLDIKIKGTIDGIEVARRLQQSPEAAPIIFITAFDDTEVFERAKLVNPVAYIVKPFVGTDLKRTIELALYKSQLSEAEANDFNAWRNDIMARDSLFIKTGDKLEKVRLQDIAYIMIEDRYLVIHSLQKKYVARMTLKDMLDKLPANDFVQVHRHYIINANHIQSIDTKTSEVWVLGHSIAISKRHKDYLLERLNTIS